MTTTPGTPARHETRALLRAHLAAATRYRHLTRHCPICHRLLRLAMEAAPGDDGAERLPSSATVDDRGAAEGRPASSGTGDGSGPPAGRELDTAAH